MVDYSVRQKTLGFFSCHDFCLYDESDPARSYIDMDDRSVSTVAKKTSWCRQMIGESSGGQPWALHVRLAVRLSARLPASQLRFDARLCAWLPVHCIKYVNMNSCDLIVKLTSIVADHFTTGYLR